MLEVFSQLKLPLSPLAGPPAAHVASFSLWVFSRIKTMLLFTKMKPIFKNVIFLKQILPLVPK